MAATCVKVGYYASDWTFYDVKFTETFGATSSYPGRTSEVNGTEIHSYTSATDSYSSTGETSSLQYGGDPDSITNPWITYTTSSSGTGETISTVDETPFESPDSDFFGQDCDESVTYTEETSNYYASKQITATGIYTTCVSSFTQTTSTSTQASSGMTSETTSATYTKHDYDTDSEYSYTRTSTSMAITRPQFTAITSTQNGYYTGPLAEGYETSGGDEITGISAQVDSGESTTTFISGSEVDSLGTTSATYESVWQTSSFSNVTFELNAGLAGVTSVVDSNGNTEYSKIAGNGYTYSGSSAAGSFGFYSRTGQAASRFTYTVLKDKDGGNSGSYIDYGAGILIIEPAIAFAYLGFGGSEGVVSDDVYGELSVASSGETFTSVATSAITDALVIESVGPRGGKLVVTGECGLPDNDSGRSLAWFTTDSSPVFDTSSLLLATYASSYTSLVDEVEQTLTSTAGASYSMSCIESVSNKNDFVSITAVDFSDTVEVTHGNLGYNDTISRDATLFFNKGTYLVTKTNSAGSSTPLTLDMTHMQSSVIPDGENWAIIYSNSKTRTEKQTYTGWAWESNWPPLA